MNKPRLVKREEISRRTVTPAPSKPSLTQLKELVRERRQLGTTGSANARVAFAALFANV
jgi:hypothetical protein